MTTKSVPTQKHNLSKLPKEQLDFGLEIAVFKERLGRCGLYQTMQSFTAVEDAYMAEIEYLCDKQGKSKA